MSHLESAIAGFYDHEQDPASRDRQRREAPDWGGDDLFTTTPSRRRRFDRPARGEHAGSSSRLRDTAEPPAPRRAATHTRSRVDAATLDLGTISDVMAPVADEPAPALLDEPLAFDAPRADADVPPAGEAVAEAFEAVAADEYRSEPPAGRRTVTITGHPESLPARRRPAPTLDQRLVGAHPERIAAYAFGMGLLLILIAFLTAGA